MKTPEEIKRGMEHCAEIGCKDCPYEEDCKLFDEFSIPAEDAYFYIKQLEQDNAQKDERIRRIGKSLFKAVIQLKQFACLTCDYSDMKHLASVCSTCENRNKWSWRGVEEDDHATD